MANAFQQNAYTCIWIYEIVCSKLYTLTRMSSSFFSCGASLIQSTLVITTSLISNNRLSRSENLVPVLIKRSTNRQQNIVEKRRNCSLGAISPLFHNIFNISLTWESKYIFILLKVVVRLIVLLSSANLICRSMDISKCFIESLGVRDNESRLYLVVQ